MNKKLLVWVLFGIIALVIAYLLISPLWRTVTLNEPPPTIIGDSQVGVSGLTLAQGNLVPSAHEVEGTAKIIGLPDGKRVLRFEDFETVNGPDLFIYLSADLEANDFVNLGEIKATEGNVNYEIPEGTDLGKYDKVLVWCRSFRVLFSYADLE